MAARSSGSWGYRPHLDGLRAIAVYLVVGFHAGVGRLTGGFIGVDIFFVLSGYLVTNLLILDLDGPDRRVQLGRFYSRRARRLLPAAAVNLIVTAIVFASIGSFLEMDAAEAAIRSAALYFANWHFIGQSAEYFAADIEQSPVLHYWSLSVEEQFYLVWPLLLGGLWWLTRGAGRRQRNVIRGVIAVAGLASAGAALHLADSALERAYYGTDTRAYQLLAGAFLALTPGVARRLSRLRVRWLFPVGSVLLVVALVVTASDLERLDPIQRGVLTTALMLGLIVSLEASDGGIAQWALSRPWMIYLGKISYGTYLWHWLVVVVLAREVELVPSTTAIVTAVVATGLASLSYQILEQPVRTAAVLDRLRAAPIVAGLTVSLLVGVVVAPAVLGRAAPARSGGSSEASTLAGSGGLPSAEVLQAAWADIYDYGSCEVSGPVACPLHDGDGLRALVVGESHAGMYSPMLTEIAEHRDLDLRAAYLSYCPWVRGIKYHGVGQNCPQDQERVYEQIIPEFDPDIVFLAHRPIDDPINPMKIMDSTGAVLDGASPSGAAALAEAASELIRSLRDEGRTVVVFEPLPVQPVDFDSLLCMSTARSVDECRYVATAEPGPEEEALRSLEDVDPDVVSVDLDRWVCESHPRCDPVEDGMVVWKDDNHLTITFASSLAAVVEEHLVDEGVFT